LKASRPILILSAPLAQQPRLPGPAVRRARSSEG
jgi:hypothetical protein